MEQGEITMTGRAARIRTTHAGSLPRPADLTELLVARAKGRPIDTSMFGVAGRAAVRRVIAKQRDAGIDVISNGEQQRESFFLHMQHRLTGLGGGWSRGVQSDIKRYPSFKRVLDEQAASRTEISNTTSIPEAVGKITYMGRALAARECADFREALEQPGTEFEEPFLTSPSPGLLLRAIRNAFYPDEDSYLRDIGEALRVEYETIVAHGFLLQLDCPDLALERHLTYQDRPVSEFIAFVDQVVATINNALVNIPRARVRIHVCWGNYEGPHDSDVPLAEILPLLLRLNTGALVLPFANGRHAHEYRCFERMRLADDQILVAGVVDTLTNFVEHPETIADRLEKVAAAVGDPSRIMAGTDCGFDTGVGRGRVAEEIVWAKLASLSEGARIASTRMLG
jgi:5-methyltetrahydropteroyltriglutamate--homocysteine methyltransferase